jgi:transketolase
MSKYRDYVREDFNNYLNVYQAYNEAIIELAKYNERIVLLYADFPSDSAGEFFRKYYPHRIYDVGIAEGNMITLAAGLAAAGLVPFTHCHGIFAVGRAYNQIRQIAYDKLNVKIVMCNCGMLWPFMGASHQLIEDLAALRAIPNLVILSPADAVETKKIVKASLDHEGPVVIRLYNPPVPTIYEDNYHYVMGKATIIREGTDVAVFATGVLVYEALIATKILEKEGIDVRLYDIHTIKPLDESSVLNAAKECGAVVTVEDGNIYGGLGGAIAEVLAENYIVVPFKRVGVRDVFGRSGGVEDLKEFYGLSAKYIVNAVKEVLKLKRKT